MKFDDLLQFFPGKPKKMTSIKAEYPLKADQYLVEQLAKFISKSVNDMSSIGLTSAVVGLSGGIDSAVSAVLLKKALQERAFGVIVDLEDNDENKRLAESFAKEIPLDYQVIQAGNIFKKHLNLLNDNNSLATLHLRSRFINNIIFQIADNRMAAVIDTTDKSERVLGRHAEAFMGHISPLHSLYKTQVYQLANMLKIPTGIITNPPGCPELLDIDAFGVTWSEIDPILHLIVDRGLKINEIAEEYNLDEEWLYKLKNRIDNQPIRLSVRNFVGDH